MDKIFSNVDRFFSSLQSYLTYNEVFLIFVGLFLFTVICVIISTAHSYEAKLIKAIDMFNTYFIDNPKITEDNLVAFNQKMRLNKVPKQLRKQWQQYVLYRENKASYYMSFENCVEVPLRSSKFKRDKITMNLLAYIFAGCALVLNSYFAYETDISTVLQRVFLAPVLILLLNYIVTIFLDLRENAIVTDLYQNYQYFEVNIDKATQTLPEYVDYEVLFDRNEIKRGIPMLYAYLQRRAEEEQRELETARLKNVEHEKFNFDEAGLAGSLVLERAMQEAENYIAERKKYNQDIEQINSEITQEDMNYREITKEYNRQMQVSKETFANFKSQLDEATSTIEINYLKKQQQQELDRQRNLERDFDTATERHKKVIESFQAELDSVDKFIDKSKKALQDAMMSEFSTYSSKVYDEAEKLVEEREKEKYAKIKLEMENLEEQLHSKNKELEKVYGKNEALAEKLGEDFDVDDYNPTDYSNNVVSDTYTSSEENQNVSESIDTPSAEESYQEYQPEYSEQSQETTEESNAQQFETMSYEDFLKNEAESNDETNNEQTQQFETMSYEDYLAQESADDTVYQGTTIPEQTENENIEENDGFAGENSNNESDDDDGDFSWFDELINDSDSTVQTEESKQDSEEGEEGHLVDETLEYKTEEEEEIQPEPEVQVDEQYRKREDIDDPFAWIDDFNDAEEDDVPQEEKVEKVEDEEIPIIELEDERLEEIAKPQPSGKRPGRPRKEKVEKPKGKPGRPKKVVKEDETPKKRPGRPRKEDVEVVDKKRPGRPRKTEEVAKSVKRKAGRPRKEDVEVENKKRPGRPKKSAMAVKSFKAKVGRPRKTEEVAKSVKKKAGRPRKTETNNSSVPVDIEAYLKVIDSAIARENARMKKEQVALENKSKINTKNKKRRT